VSKLIVHSLTDNNISIEKTSDNFRWAASVASFGMLLRQSEFINGFSEMGCFALHKAPRVRIRRVIAPSFISLVKADRLVTVK